MYIKTPLHAKNISAAQMFIRYFNGLSLAEQNNNLINMQTFHT
jgi:hypothetical protein